MILADLVVKKLIGSGGFGEVLMVISKKTKKTYAIKLMNKLKITNCGKSLSIFREKSILKSLVHKNIVKLEASFTNQEDLFLLLELVEGDDLGDIIQDQGRQDPTFVQHVIKQLLSALQCMHQYGFYHGDIKPQNIMITKDYTVKLVDFGCANYFEVNEPNQLVVQSIEKFKAKLNELEIDDFNGTSYYASPELLNEGSNTWKDDLWSLGVLTYQLLTGKLPFEGDNEHLTMNIICSMVYEKRPAVESN